MESTAYIAQRQHSRGWQRHGYTLYDSFFFVFPFVFYAQLKSAPSLEFALILAESRLRLRLLGGFANGKAKGLMYLLRYLGRKRVSKAYLILALVADLGNGGLFSVTYARYAVTRTYLFFSSSSRIQQSDSVRANRSVYRNKKDPGKFWMKVDFSALFIGIKISVFH